MGMRVARRALIDEARSQNFHVTSRVVDRRFIFEDGEKEYFLRVMRRLEAFTGVQVLSYCLMSNHFHLLLHIPIRPEKIGEEEVMRRIRGYYSERYSGEIQEYLRELERTGNTQLKEAYLNRFRERMYDLSGFVKELKLKFSKYYNAQNDRKGTLWEERYKCSLVEGQSNALMNTAAYIELNSVRAGIVDDPLKYRWCSYAEAAAGGKRARDGIIRLASGMQTPLQYKEALKVYRMFFLAKSVAQSGSKAGMDPEELHRQRELSAEKGGGEFSNAKLRYFSEGLIIGSQEFIEEIYNRSKNLLNPTRKKVASKVRELAGELYSFRNTRSREVIK